MKINKISIARILLPALVFIVVIFARNRYTDSDPRGSLLVAESLLDRQTIRLDYYGEKTLGSYGYVVHGKGGHAYYYFPLGTPVVSTPLVALAKGFGVNIQQHEAEIQIAIAAFTAALTVIFLMMLAQLFLTPVNSLIIASVFWFGTSLASTTGTALWSHDFATLFALMAIYFSIRMTKNSESGHWPVIAVSLFAAYFCRPTMALLSPLLLAYILSYDRSAAFKVSGSLIVLLGAFIIYSINEFGQILPDYYMPTRPDYFINAGTTPSVFPVALFGNLFSPARGLFIYSPFILAAWLCYRSGEKHWELKKSWLLPGLAWPLFHLILVSRFPKWWAGHSFGTRFMTDIMPGLFLLTLYTWPATLTGLRRRVSVLILVLASVFSVYVNTVQGLFNKYTAEWNGNPNIDEHPEYLFDWRYPQFMASKKGHEERLVRHTNQMPTPDRKDED